MATFRTSSMWDENLRRGKLVAINMDNVTRAYAATLKQPAQQSWDPNRGKYVLLPEAADKEVTIVMFTAGTQEEVDSIYVEDCIGDFLELLAE